MATTKDIMLFVEMAMSRAFLRGRAHGINEAGELLLNRLTTPEMISLARELLTLAKQLQKKADDMESTDD